MFGFKDKPSAPETTETPRRGLFARLREQLGKTRRGLTGGLATLFQGRQIDDDLLEELETRLLLADVGIDATRPIIADLTARLKHHQLTDGTALVAALREEMEAILDPVTRPLVTTTADGATFVVLMIGVNGAGKTTTIGKLARHFQAEGRSVMLAAGDTFRAAAVEQLQAWGQRHDVPVIAQQTGADSASVVFDALQAARARNIDVLIADTAGRLHTQSNLMEELKKVVRVLRKLDPLAPHEVMLVPDRHHPDQARWHRQGGHRAGDRARTRRADPLHRHRRTGRRPAPVRRSRVRRRPARPRSGVMRPIR